MERCCEVCESLRHMGLPTPENPGGRIVRRVFGERIVALCGVHAAEARHAGVTQLEELCWLFTLPGERRSLIPRRSPIDRRVFPARPEGRRYDAGRRAEDGV